MTSRRAHWWGAFWYYPFEQLTAYKVIELIANSTKSYPYLHNQKFKVQALQNYHDGIFARIGTAADQVLPVSFFWTSGQLPVDIRSIPANFRRTSGTKLI